MTLIYILLTLMINESDNDFKSERTFCLILDTNVDPKKEDY